MTSGYLKLLPFHVFIFIFTFSLLSSCSSQKPKGKTEAEILYKEAKELVKSERYLLATEKLNTIKTQHSYSYYATPAELLQADILFLQENFIEATAAYLLFRDFHPKHERIPYVVFKIAESYFNQIPETIDRDLESAAEAIQYYEELRIRYPQSRYVRDAVEKIKKAKQMLVQKDQYIADFYFKTKKYSAAQYWYKDILKTYQQKKMRNHAMLRIILSYKELKKWDFCVDSFEKFQSELDKVSLLELKPVKKLCKRKLSMK